MMHTYLYPTTAMQVLRECTTCLPSTQQYMPRNQGSAQDRIVLKDMAGGINKYQADFKLRRVDPPDKTLAMEA